MRRRRTAVHVSKEPRTKTPQINAVLQLQIGHAMDPRHAHGFRSEAEAVRIAAINQADDGDPGATYAVACRLDGAFIVMVADDFGDIGYL